MQRVRRRDSCFTDRFATSTKIDAVDLIPERYFVVFCFK